jgi:Amt family ammonium transporter
VELNTGNTAWVLMSSALVMLMTPGLGLFYGGLVRKKNVLSTLMHSYFILCLIAIVWALWGYSIAFGGTGRFFGNLDYIGLRDVGVEPGATGVPAMVFMFFQMMFAIITVALISGAFAERKNFKAFIVFAVLWSTLVYSVVCHWVWAAGGWLFDYGAMDFAGGTVVHIASGVTALVAAIVIGRRAGVEKEGITPHDIPMTLIGAGLLWFGWYGFNAGSALAADGLAANAFVATTLAAAAAGLSWVAIAWIRTGKPSVLGTGVGAVAGLVAITPAAGFVNPLSSIAIGLVSGVLCFFAAELIKAGGQVDDALDVFAVHGVGGIWGAIATGIFADASLNGIGADGLLYGNPEQLVKQIVAVVAVILYVTVVSFVLLKIVDAVFGLRASEDAEAEGLDLSLHGETAYQM